MIPGYVFPVYDETELVTKFINTSLKRDIVLASGKIRRGRTRRSASFSHGFAVDKGISTGTVSIIVGYPNIASQVLLVGPGDMKINPQAATPMSLIFEILNPKGGPYQLILPDTVENYEYNAQGISGKDIQGISKKSIDFTNSFIISKVSVGIVHQSLWPAHLKVLLFILMQIFYIQLKAILFCSCFFFVFTLLFSIFVTFCITAPLIIFR